MHIADESCAPTTLQSRSSVAAASPWPRLALAMLGAIPFSGKAIIAKLAYRYGVDAITLVMLRMLFALPMFVVLAWWGGRGRGPVPRGACGALLGVLFLLFIFCAP